MDLDPAAAEVNGAIEAISTIMPTVVSSAAEAELAGLFLNGQCALSTRTTLASLGHPQSSTPLITDNTTAWASLSKPSASSVIVVG